MHISIITVINIVFIILTYHLTCGVCGFFGGDAFFQPHKNLFERIVFDGAVPFRGGHGFGGFGEGVLFRHGGVGNAFAFRTFRAGTGAAEHN